MAPDRATVVRRLRQHAPGFLIEAGVNFIVPAAIYYLASPSMGEVKALLLSSAPPIVWSCAEFVRHRRLDAVSILVLAGIVLSLLAFLGGGSAKFLQLREKLVTVAIGCAFLFSVGIGRPLIYELARASMKRRSSADLADFEKLKDNPGFKRSMRLMTLVWGLGLVVEALISAALVFAVSVGQYLIIGPLVGYSVLGGLTLWTFYYARRRRRLRSAVAAADEAGPSQASGGV